NNTSSRSLLFCFGFCPKPCAPRRRLRAKFRPLPDEDIFRQTRRYRQEMGAPTGNKGAASIFYWHTGYPGGIKGRSKGAILDGKHPERVIEKAVERMVPRGPLGRKVMSNLRVYAGPGHPHEATSPDRL